MSLFARTFAPLRASSRAIQRPVAAFSTSSARNAMSESDHADNHPDRAKKIDEHKHDSVSKAKQGKGEWNEKLATNSEQAAGADKDGKSIEEMQKMGEQQAKKDN